jgi:acetamidase/formamidase
LFTVGDGHFAQGDGEICGTAIETMMRSRIRLTVIKGKPALKSPHYETAVQQVVEMHSVQGKGEYGVVATAEDQPTAARKALEGLMDWLVTEKGLTRVEAYMLISVAGNLKIMRELGPVHTVSASMPLGIFMKD